MTMKMDELISLGFPQTVIDIWKKEESEDLLLIQERAIREFSLLEDNSGNLLVIAPTSSGKTFLGELTAIRNALRMRPGLILVPYKAIAEEIYNGFRKKYGEYGFRIAISNRDHREHDEELINNLYDIGIVVYEKLAGLLVVKPDLLEQCGLVIADEVQMMMEANRGPTIELLLTKLLLAKKKPKLIALSAVLDDLNDFDKWLRAKVLREGRRPVELREGVYTPDGIVRYKEFNGKARGTEHHGAYQNKKEGLRILVQSIIDRKEQVLVFCDSRDQVIELASQLSEEISGTSPARTSIAQANDLQDSIVRENLQNLLRSSVAYHTSDLALEERLLVEQGFRAREIRILVSTSTLAMGINLPTRNVIVYSLRAWTGSSSTAVSVGAYKNMAGRAGRYSAGDPYGTSYLIAESQAQADSYYSNYINGRLEGFASQFGDQPIDSQILDVLSVGLARTEDRIAEIIFSTYNGKYKWTTGTTREYVRRLISDTVAAGLEVGAIKKGSRKEIEITPAGRLCAAGGFSLKHLKFAVDYLRAYKEDAGPSIVYWALETDARSGGSAYHIRRLTTMEYNHGRHRYHQMLCELGEQQEMGPLLDPLTVDPESIDYDECVTLRRCLALCGWISGISSRKLEEGFAGVTIGAIRNTAEICAWLVSFLADLTGILISDDKRHLKLDKLADRLLYGATEESIELCHIRDNGLSRDDKNHLAQHGIRTLDDVLNKEPKDIPLPRRKALKLTQAAGSTILDSLEKRKRYQELRLSHLGLDTSILVSLYTKEGKDLEHAVTDLLKAPFASLKCTEVTRQNEGEPDHVLYDDAGKVYVAQVTARQGKNISMTKATSVIGQSSRYKPQGYIVLGRPDFDTLAIKDCRNQTASGRNYKLIPIPVLGEIFVMFHEKLLSSEDVDRIFTQEKGYIGFSEIERYKKGT
jgi:replicative superfamily II helicase